MRQSLPAAWVTVLNKWRDNYSNNRINTGRIHMEITDFTGGVTP